jgi:hypothetical protein
MLMQFTPEQRDLVYANKKTVHRIPAESGARYREGRAYRVRVRGEDRPLVLTVVAPVLEQQLGDMQPRDAIREGAKHLREFLQTFAMLYGDASPSRRVCAIEIAPGDLRDVPRFLASGGPVPICKAIDRSDGKVCNRGFAVGQDRCKCGAKRPPDSADDHGYTTSRIRAIDEAEALSDDELARYSGLAHGELLRDMPRKGTVAEATFHAGALRESMAAMRQRSSRKAFNRVKLIERELAKLADEVPSAQSVC